MRQKGLMENDDNIFREILDASLNSYLEYLNNTSKAINFSEIADRLYDLYVNRGYKHRHCEIAIFFANKNEDILEESSMHLVYAFRGISDYIDTDDFKEKHSKEDNFEKFQDKIKRLVDHIELECVHLDNFAKKQKIQEYLEESRVKIGEIENRAKTVEDQIQNQQNQYITILGIFASIVLTIVGGFIFSTSVLAHMHEVGMCRLAFVICCITLLFLNIIYALFNFVLKFSNSKLQIKHLQKLNIVLIVLIIGAFAGAFFESSSIDGKTTSSPALNILSCPTMQHLFPPQSPDYPKEQSIIFP